MNSKKFLVLYFVFLLFTSCTEKISEAPIVRQISKQYENSYENGSTNDLYIEELIATYPEDFINVRIYGSWTDIQNELDALNEMSFEELRIWCSDNTFSNIAIESNIIYDSLMTTMATQLGELEDDINFPSEECLCSVFEQIGTTYSELFPQYESNLEPIEISLYALLNSNHLLIVDSYVYMEIDEGLIGVSYQDYPTVRELSRNKQAFYNIATIDPIVYKPRPEILLSDIVCNDKYKLKYKYSVEYTPHPFYQTSDIVVSLLIKNYKRIGCTDCIIKREISVDTQFSVYYPAENIELVGNTENYHFGPWTTNRKYKYDFTHHYYFADIVPYYGAHITVQYLQASNEEVFVDL